MLEVESKKRIGCRVFVIFIAPFSASFLIYSCLKLASKDSISQQKDDFIAFSSIKELG